jgi:hypothetical protein
MKRLSAIATGLLAIVLTLAGCATQPSAEAGWITIFDGSNLNNFVRIGDANWRLVDGVVQADLGGKTSSYIVTKESYTDFELRAEFWVDSDANSGIFLRMTDLTKIASTTGYEANINDKSSNPAYGTGGMPNVAPTAVPMKVGGQWNVYEITAKGPQITVTLNGVRTIDIKDTKFAKGPIGLQYGSGVVKFRKIQIRPI